MVERHIDIVKAAGSIPASRTKRVEKGNFSEFSLAWTKENHAEKDAFEIEKVRQLDEERKK